MTPAARRAGLLFAACFGLLAAPSARAHELGVVRVNATFAKDATFSIELLADVEHLPPGLALPVPRPAKTRFGPIAGLPAAEAASHGAFLGAFLDTSRAAFDGTDAGATARYVRRDGPILVLRLDGDVPAGAKTFTWTSGLPLGFYVLKLAAEGDEAETRQWLEAGRESEPFRLNERVVPPPRGALVRRYLSLGFTHILPKGLDHILFVLGLFLLSTRARPLLLQVTAFTLAHTLTLGLSMLGVVRLSPRVVEPLIALSIAYVAIENLATSELKPWRPFVVFGFGLLHGMGFAGVLTEIGLPRSEFVPALLSFNAGVELGQLTVLTGAFLLLAAPFRRQSWYRKAIVVPGSLLIAAAGLFWTVQRLTSG